jgi:hypothetical protein
MRHISDATKPSSCFSVTYERGQPKPFYGGETPYSQSCARVEPPGGKPYRLFLGLPRYYPVGGIPSERFEAKTILFDPMESLQIPTGDTRAGMGLHSVSTAPRT